MAAVDQPTSDFYAELNQAWEELDLPAWDKLAHHVHDSWLHLAQFVELVDWREPLFITLALFYTAIFILAISTRKKRNVQIGLWLLCCTCKRTFSPAFPPPQLCSPLTCPLLDSQWGWSGQRSG